MGGAAPNEHLVSGHFPLDGLRGYLIFGYLRHIMAQLGLKFLTLHGPLIDIHKILKGKTFLGEEILSFVFLGFADIQLHIEIEVIGNLTSVHLLT